MRRLAAVILLALSSLYVAGALVLYQQERWSQDLPPSVEPERLRHPEAVMSLVQQRFQANRFGAEERALVVRSLLEVPGFFQPPFLLATFHANRLDEPGSVRDAFEAAVARYPANGRLQLAYGSWLLESRGSLSGWLTPEGLVDPLPRAEKHLKAAMTLEPELAWSALGALSRNRVPTTRWAALVPDDPLAKTHLLDALFQAGEVDAVWQGLSDGAFPSDDPNVLRRIVYWGLEGKRPDIALDAAQKWKAAIEKRSGSGPDLLEPVLAISRSYQALGRPEAAYEVVASTLERVESTFGASSRVALDFLCAFGDEYRNRGQAVTAESLFQQAISRNPTFTPALLGLARTLRQLGEDEAAAARYEAVLRIEPGDRTARRELEATLARMGKTR